jgi:hypothetical protein
MASPEEKNVGKDAVDDGYVPQGADEEVGVINKSDPLKQDLQNRHMQMIAIGTSLPTQQKPPNHPFAIRRLCDLLPIATPANKFPSQVALSEPVSSLVREAPCTRVARLLL